MRFLFFLLFSFLLSAQTVVISDIDDTIKKANVLSWSGALQYFFRSEEFPAMRTIFQDIKKSDEAHFHYVSASFRFLYDAQYWVSRKGFPTGSYQQKKINSGEIFDYKYMRIRDIIKNYDISETFFYFFGDNSSQDVNVYKAIIKDYDLKAEVYIRDVQVNAFPLTDYLGVRPVTGVHYFLSEYDLLQTPLRSLFSFRTIQTVARQFQAKQAVVDYIKEQTEERLLDTFCDQLIPGKTCRDEVREINQEVWQEYYEL